MNNSNAVKYMIEQHPVLFIIFVIISVFWSVIGAGIFWDTYKNYWTNKQWILAFVIAGPIAWLGTISLIIIKLTSSIVDKVWNSKYLK